MASVIEDDGCTEIQTDLTATTIRKIKLIETVQTSGAAFGKPHVESEFYQELNGEMIPLKKTEYFYDVRGLEIKQRIYQSQNDFCYEIIKNYDSRGRVIQESNPLGELTDYAYDDQNNKTKEKLQNSGKSIRYTYDLANRLTSKSEKHKNGEIFVTAYTYNPLNQLIAEVDPYGNQTTYTYDRFGNQTQCIKPQMQEADGQVIRPLISKTYNALGQLLSQIDEKNFTTSYTYNVYGSPTQIRYPDGAIERLTYYPCGWLKQKWQADGTSVRYLYDSKGHVVKESTLDVNGGILKEEEYAYKGALLIYKKDAMGLVTTYRYDRAGRKIEESSGLLRTIKYAYDEFDRLIRLEKESQQESYQYDWLNRRMSKTWQDNQGCIYAKETYEYDRQGNQICKAVWQGVDQVAFYRSHYQSDGKLSFTQDPLGHSTTWLYDTRYRNNLGQAVEQRSIKDALNRVTIEVDDAFQRLVQKECYESNQLSSSTSYYYDAAGHLVKQQAIVRADGQLLREYTIRSSYNERGWLTAENEMPAGKTTAYTHDHMGRLIQKIKPDGVSLQYAYDELGRLKTLVSTDGSISYAYHYDLHNNPIEIQDLIHKTIQRCTYDELDRLIVEQISAGISLHYTYDALDRLIQFTLTDGSFILYTYDPFHLRHVQRFDAFGKLCYECDCLIYDQQGHVLQERSPAGMIDYTYDLLGRQIGIEAAHWKSQLEAFDPVGNLLARKQIDPSGEEKTVFCYDCFNHLTSESGFASNRYTYDSLGNCLMKNGQVREINALNQVTHDKQSSYTYDANGNLIAQLTPPISYRYDALNRLISCEQEGLFTRLTYDAFGRCLNMTDAEGCKQLLYQKDQEIGSLFEGKIRELRVVHPEEMCDKVFALELEQEIFFPLQDFHHHICALHKKDGRLIQWTSYSAFGKKVLKGDQAISNPWGFANRREVAGLVLFAHRFYNPHLMRWQTTDPIRFKDGLNLYHYVHNNPFRYKDPDGKFAFVLPILYVAFGGTLAISTPTIMTIVGSTAAFAAGWAVYEVNKWYDNKYNQVNEDQDELNEEKKPKYLGSQLGTDPAKCPGEGFEWKGRGEPATGKGNWVKGTNQTKETLHPDLNHPEPLKPHWDYTSADFPKGVRLYPDDTWEIKQW